MTNLTDEQRRAILQIGDPESVFEKIPSDILDELVALGLLYRRSDKNLDFTDLGNDIYDSLIARS